MALDEYPNEVVWCHAFVSVLPVGDSMKLENSSREMPVFPLVLNDRGRRGAGRESMESELIASTIWSWVLCHCQHAPSASRKLQAAAVLGIVKSLGLYIPVINASSMIATRYVGGKSSGVIWFHLRGCRCSRTARFLSIYRHAP